MIEFQDLTKVMHKFPKDGKRVWCSLTASGNRYILGIEGGEPVDLYLSFEENTVTIEKFIKPRVREAIVHRVHFETQEDLEAILFKAIYGRSHIMRGSFVLSSGSYSFVESEDSSHAIDLLNGPVGYKA
jgi:hypothetical protein